MKKYENFCRAYKNLSESIVLEPPYDTVTLTGLVGLYEIAFEQAWKLMKELFMHHGFDEGTTGSPRMIIKTAYQAKMINDEKSWLKALDARNNVSHSYNEEIALSIIEECKHIYMGMFTELKNCIEENWLDK